MASTLPELLFAQQPFLVPHFTGKRIEKIRQGKAAYPETPAAISNQTATREKYM
ncbi:hypothetical protein I5535_06955 [Rhodobacteraceae bacterium F11138]|nr:hypothetical protein [Rhodobacteraceae bacterium F11138]